MLKHGTQRGNRGTAFRNGLVVFQFTVSIILIVGTFIIRDQLGFMRSKNLGFTKEQVITIDLSDIGGSRLDVLKQELMKSPRVVDLSNTTSIPGRADAFSSSTYRIFDAPAENAQQLRWMFADARFVDTYRMTMSEGTFLRQPACARCSGGGHQPGGGENPSTSQSRRLAARGNGRRRRALHDCRCRPGLQFRISPPARSPARCGALPRRQLGPVSFRPRVPR